MVKNLGLDLDVLHILKNSSNSLEIELSLIIIGNLIFDDQNIDNLINGDILTVLSKHMLHQLPEIRRISIWCVTNIAAGRIDHINALLHSGIINQIFYCINDTNCHVVYEVFNTFYNILIDSDVQMCEQLVNMGLLKVVVHIFTTIESQVVLSKALKILKKVFSHGETIQQNNGYQVNPYVHKFTILGGDDRLEKLQYLDSQDIYDLSVEILDKYFQVI